MAVNCVTSTIEAWTLVCVCVAVVFGKVVSLAGASRSPELDGHIVACGKHPGAVRGDTAAANPVCTMRAELIGHFKACMTEIYLHIDARVADYIRTHP